MKGRYHLVLSLILSFALGLLHPSASGSGSSDCGAAGADCGVKTSRPDKTAHPSNPPAQEPEPTSLPGQSATLLPDGRWLKIGGEGPNGPVDTASIWDPRTKASTPLRDRLLYPRAYHSATLLPDGTLLILGGVGPQDQVVDRPELFNLERQRFENLPFTGLTPRAHHTATLLTEGRLLIAGGISEKGDLIAEAELWDPQLPQTERRISHFTSRSRHTATLLGSGEVLLWGGVDLKGEPLNQGELYDPVSQSFSSVEVLPPPPSTPDTQPPALAASIPREGADPVPKDIRIALRFSELMQVERIHLKTIALTGRDGKVSVTIVPAEGGMLAFITPEHPLLPGERYTLSISGLADLADLPLAETAIHFTTAGDASSHPSDEEEWTPKDLRHWRTDRPSSSWQSLPPLQAEPGMTALAGQVLALNGKPLSGVKMEIEDRTAYTDQTGRFLLTSLAPGRHVLVVDGRTANRRGRTYGIFEIGVVLLPGKTDVLDYKIWMPAIDTAHAVPLSSPTSSEAVVTTPRIPGLEVRIAPQTVVRDRAGEVVTSVSITPIPVDRPPFPLPAGVDVPVYFTVQPGGADLETLSDQVTHGARIVYPNYLNQPPGARIDFWDYDPTEVGWYIYGQGTVTPDGKQVVLDPGIAIYRFTGAMASCYCAAPRLGGGTPPNFGPAPGNTNGDDGDPVDLGTGLFVLEKTDLLLPDLLPLALTRTYRPEDPNPRPFGIGMTHRYQTFLVGDTTNYSYAQLILPDGGRVHYTRISAGTGYSDAVFEHTATPGRFYRSQIRWNGNGWNLTLKDGMVYVFGNNAPLQSIRDRYGNQIMITRTGGQTGNITRITSPNGRWIDFTYDAGNRITEAKDSIGRVVAYTYDAGGRLWRVTDPMGGITEYTYDASHRMLTIKDARGIVFLTNVYDANGRVIKQTQADLTTYQFAYTIDASGRITRTDVTDPRGAVRRVTFNAGGYTLTDTRAFGKPEQQTTTFERKAAANLILSLTDPLGRKTTYLYDAMGNVTTLTRLSGTTEAVTTTMTYEPSFNQIAGITDPLNHATTFTYDTKGNVIAVTDPLGNRTNLIFNISGQPTSITDPLGNTTQFTYDFGDFTGVTDPLGNSATRFVDNAGRLLSITHPLGHFTRYDYDVLNRVSRVTDPSGGISSFSYDANGNLLSVTDARNSVTRYAYDSMDRLESRTDPLLLTERYLYDNNGNLATFTDRKTQVTGFAYDALNRRTGVTYVDSSTVAYTYDAGNRVTQIVDSISGTITRTYDNLDRLTSETTPEGSISYTYDAANRRTSMTVAGQPTVNYMYDAANRLTQITQGTSTVTLTYDAAGRRTGLTFPHGVVAEYTYDAASRLTGLTYKKDLAVLGNLTYTYDAAGNRSKVGGTWARTGLPSPLPSATYNAANQMITFGSRSLSYDANGNLTSDGTTTYTWDARNRLGSLSATGMIANFQYDSLGRRVSRTINGTSTHFLYDGQNPVQELAGTTPTANLLTGLGIDQFFVRSDSAGTSSLLTDVLGSTFALTDSAGTVQAEYTYESFGKATVTGTSANPFQYTGRENDGTELYYYRARYYSPSLSRFISEDPLHLGSAQLLRQATPGFSSFPLLLQRHPALLHQYAYVGNNPLIYTDPYGLFFWPGAAVGAGVGAIGGAAGALAQGGSAGDIAAAALIGAGAGAIIGGFNITSPAWGAVIGGFGDVVGQFITGHGRKDFDFNFSSVIGAGLGGALGNFAGNFFGNAVANAGWGQGAQSAIGALGGMGPSTAVGLVGNGIGQATGF